ncbi:MAG: homoserine dehydrogenase [Opitutales bacterium]
MDKPVVIKIGICGLGVVGQGVWKHLQRDRSRLEARLGVKLELARAAVRDIGKKRPVRIPASRLTTDAMDVATDPELQIICELMGGTDEARVLTLAALERGKIVISANKALLCDYGEEIFAAARRGGGHYFFEASVAGGIPIIKALREGLVANRFPLIYGVLNGTCNYILTRMEQEGLSFSELLKQARNLGYVEADESLDVDGWDTAHKASILAFLAHGRWVGTNEMLVEGIRKITQDDICNARAFGYSIKLLAVITRDFDTDNVFVRVHPALVPLGRVLGNLRGPYNGVCVSGDVVGTTLYIGRGAGQDATASAVISDIADAVLLLKGSHTMLLPDQAGRVHEESSNPCGILTLDKVHSPYYLRLTVDDAPGVLAEIATILARNGVSLASVLQREIADSGKASIILTTHLSNEKDMQKTLNDLRESASVKEEPFLLRIVDFEE